jgi:hypothetical protein
MKHITDRCQPLVSPEFLGPVVSQEIMWAFYEKNLFHLHEIELLKSFLTTDIFGKGCAPSDFVRNLRIGMLDSTFLEGWSWDPTDADSVVPVRSSERLAHLNHLDIIKNKSGLELTFLIRAGRRYVSHQLIYNIGITVFRLRDHGFKVKVAQEMKKKKSKRWKLQSSKKLYAWPGADWTFLLDGDREEWQRKAERQELHVCARCEELG